MARKRSPLTVDIADGGESREIPLRGFKHFRVQANVDLELRGSTYGADPEQYIRIRGDVAFNDVLLTSKQQRDWAHFTLVEVDTVATRAHATIYFVN